MTRLPTSNQFGGNLFQAIQQAGAAPQQAGPPPIGGQPANPPFRRLGVNQYGPSVRNITKGSLVIFSYMFHKPGHDPSPLVLITDIWTNYLRGLNLHYLTFPYVKRLLQPNCDNPSFSYSNIKGDEYIVSAFRQYKRAGIRKIKRLDCSFLLNVLASVRSFDPSEVEAIRKSVREQIQKITNPPAAPGPPQPYGPKV